MPWSGWSAGSTPFGKPCCKVLFAIEHIAHNSIFTRANGLFGIETSSVVYRREVVLTSGADLTPESVICLWPNWLTREKLHLLAGAPGQGQTTIAMAMVATFTSGGPWPDGSRCEPGNVLIWSGQNDPADTLLPRLIASGADRPGRQGREFCVKAAWPTTSIAPPALPLAVEVGTVCAAEPRRSCDGPFSTPDSENTCTKRWAGIQIICAKNAVHKFLCQGTWQDMPLNTNLHFQCPLSHSHLTVPSTFTKTMLS